MKRSWVAATMLMACYSTAAESRQVSTWVTVRIQGTGFSSYYAIKAARFVRLGRTNSERLRALEGKPPYAKNNPKRLRVGTDYYLIPICQRPLRWANPPIWTIGSGQKEITLECP